MSLDTVFLEAGIDAELVRRVVEDLVDRDDEKVSRLRLGDLPDLGDAGIPLVLLRLQHGEGARRAHPVERFVAQGVGVHEHAAVGLDHEQPGAEGEVRTEPPRIVNGALGNDETHGLESRRGDEVEYLPC